MRTAAVAISMPSLTGRTRLASTCDHRTGSPSRRRPARDGPREHLDVEREPLA